MRAGLIFLSLLAAIATFAVIEIHAQEGVEHPFIEPKDIKPETCLTCHPEKKDAKFVHTAVGMGCERCHRITSADHKTAITLVATGGDLCATCHAPKKDPVLHGPYKAGQCLVCHDPHTGAYAAQIRADVNTLCLGCHGSGQRNVKASADQKTVSLAGNQSVDVGDYSQAPKLALDPSGISGHPVKGHPLTGKDPRAKNAPWNCVSCHDPHSSALPKLMPQGVKSGQDLCAECHRQ